MILSGIFEWREHELNRIEEKQQTRERTEKKETPSRSRIDFLHWNISNEI